MRVDWCVSSWFRIKNTHSLTLCKRYRLTDTCVQLLSLALFRDLNVQINDTDTCVQLL